MTRRNAVASVDKMLHDAHLRYQRQQMKADVVDIPCSEVRGVRREMSLRERNVVWLPEWSTHLRPNFWKAYFDTLMYMSR